MESNFLTYLFAFANLHKAVFGAVGSVTSISVNNAWVFYLDGNSNASCIILSTLYGSGSVASVLVIAVTAHDWPTFVTPPLYLPKRI